MNSKRAANRAASRRSDSHEPEHNERGFRPRNDTHMSHGSPASKGASIGNGAYAGSDMLNSPGAGPGQAAKRFMGRDKSETPDSPTPPGTPPKGMKTYREE